MWAHDKWTLIKHTAGNYTTLHYHTCVLVFSVMVFAPLHGNVIQQRNSSTARSHPCMLAAISHQPQGMKTWTNALSMIWGSTTLVVMKCSVFWDIMPYIPLKISRCFRGHCCLHLQGQRINLARHQQQAELCFRRLHSEGVSIDSGWSAICSSRNGVARGALCVCCRGVYS
jgi:hypothetical protein